MKRKILFLLVITFFVFSLSIMMVIFFNRKRDIYSYHFPTGYKKLNWGMDTEEIIDILGKPSSMERNEYQDTLVYDTMLPTDLGSCSKLTLYIGRIGDEKSKQGTDTIKLGLGCIEMQIQDTTKEKIFELLRLLYGELTVQNTEMERDLKEGIPDYFRKRCYSEKWYADELLDEEYSELEKTMQACSENRSLLKKSLLFYINVSGIESENTYTCNIQLDAVLLAYLLMSKAN